MACVLLFYAGMAGVNRRDLLRGAGAGALLLACRGARGPSGNAQLVGRVEDGEALVTRLDEPYCAETPVEVLVERWITPVPVFYVLEHGRPPAPDARRWTLEIGGMVRRPLRLTVADVEARAVVEVPATLVCAGNRRREHHARRPVRDPLLWSAGAIGNAVWTGARLAELLAEAGVLAGARHVWLDGGDALADGTFFGGSIELARVRDAAAPPVVLAYRMNGAPLTRSHGFPLRAVVPGHIGARSVKWLRRITVADRLSPNASFVRSHRLDDEPIYDVPINAAICAVDAAGDHVRVRGYAIAGSPVATIARVEVSLDGGRWRAATLDPAAAPSCWRLWSIDLPAPRHRARIFARAIDTTGRIQPRDTAWNEDGYLYNGWATARLRTGSG